VIFFITGGSRGIGRALVEGVLEAGHDVAFTFLERQQAADELCALAAERFPGRRCRAYRLDVSRSEQVEQVGEDVLADFETVDVVVTSAAQNRQGLAFSLTDEDWHHVIETNLSGAFYVARQFLPTFLASKRGRFIHLSSISRDGMAGQIAYSASKAGLGGLSGALAKEYGRKGVTSNVLVLGFFDTDMTREQMTEENKVLWRRFCPAGRMGEMSEVTAAVLFLASDGGAFVNGQSLGITGGLDWVR
jgi:NAD(P)-dependent dehydrogenase (short-subunit alcohol dehydrogenase family)